MRPTTESMPWSPTFAAAAIDSALTLTTRRPSSNVIAPANTSAVYSPRDKPAHEAHESTTAGESIRSFDGGESGDEQRGLRKLGGVQLLLRSVDANVEQVVPEDLLRLVAHLLHRGDVRDGPEHANRLGTLAGEEEGDGEVVVAVVRRRGAYSAEGLGSTPPADDAAGGFTDDDDDELARRRRVWTRCRARA